MKKTKSIEECLLEAAELLRQEGEGQPMDAWAYGYGRVLIDGELTSQGIKWVKEVLRKHEDIT